MRPLSDIITAVKYSTRPAKFGVYEASFNIEVDGNTWECYEVSISNQDILCVCDKGTATFIVDRYGDRLTFELFDWNSEEES